MWLLFAIGSAVFAALTSILAKVEELAVSDSVGALYRCFMALLLPGASGRGSLEGRTGRQDEHRADVDSGVYLPA